MPMKAIKVALMVAALGCVGAAPAAKPRCDADPRVAAAAKAWLAHAQQPPLAIDLAAAPCFRNALLARLAPSLGPVIGYKVGVYTAAARANYHIDRPLVGILRRGMIFPEGRPIPIDFAFAPMAEADFLLVVRDAGINQARTREEAYRHIRGYRPFIELPDNHYPAPVAADAGRVAALDVGARGGVMGAEVALPPTAAGLAALTAMSVKAVIAAPSGTSETSAKSLESLGDPMEIVLWARDLLSKEGIRLKPGDILSLGTMTPPHPPVAGETFTVRYEIGGRVSEIAARFTP
jgi:2-oxo-hept-3-ene-1,7-dioate hydratase